jgi:hypothetical protein
MKKNMHKAAGLVLALTLITPLFASAQTVSSTTDVTSQIQSLLSQITSLEAQLHALVSSVMGNSTTTIGHPMGTSTRPMMGGEGDNNSQGCPQFSRNLSIGAQGSDVSQLQDMLEGDGFLSASSTGFFGPLTAHALGEFQAHFGIASSSVGTGFFGSITRNFIHIRCGGPNGSMGSSTPQMMPNMPWNQGTTTGGDPRWMGVMGSTTPPRPCSQDNSGVPTTSDRTAAAAMTLFIPHALVPGMMPPCIGATGEMQQQ